MVGHAGGDVRVYQFCDSPQNVHRMNIDEARIPYENIGQQVGSLQGAAEERFFRKNACCNRKPALLWPESSTAAGRAPLTQCASLHPAAPLP